jgi:hypothetical protein
VPANSLERDRKRKEQMTGRIRIEGRPHEAGRYEIRLQGHLAQRWASWFDGLSLSHEADGTTVLRGLVVDQAALHGLLQRVRDTGLPLVSVTHSDTQETNERTNKEIDQ